MSLAGLPQRTYFTSAGSRKTLVKSTSVSLQGLGHHYCTKQPWSLTPRLLATWTVTRVTVALSEKVLELLRNGFSARHLAGLIGQG